jgi:hypothetical protein
MASSVDYYRYYVPVAPTLNLTIVPSASNTIASQNVDVYNGVHSSETMINLGFTPYGTDTVDVFVNGVNIVNKLTQSVVGGYNHSRFSIVGSMLTWVKSPNPGDTVKVVSYLSFSEPAYATIDLSELMVQGKILNNTDPTFTGSVECYPIIMHQPVNGFVRPAWDRRGFEYSFNATGPFGDSFSYKFVSRYGQESEPACIFINQGVTGSSS